MFNQYSSLEFLPIKQDDASCELQHVKIVPPSTYEEWLKYNDIDTWPVDPDEVNDKSWLDVNVGTIDELCLEVKTKAPFQVNILDDILKEVELLEEKVNEYSEYFFGVNPKRKHGATKGNEKYLQCRHESYDNRRALGIQKKQDSLKARNMEFAVFPGFHPYGMTLLPGALEAPQLLNNITKIQNFQAAFRKLWKQFFLSEASVGILQDAFWWVFLESSKSNNSSKSTKNDEKIVSQSKLFDRMASNFVSLFISIPYDAKDRFFKHFPNCLSQAVYSAFVAAFPLSSSKFNIEFREDLVTLIYEWVNGIRPQEQHILKTWNLEVLENQDQSSHDCFDEPLHVLKSHLSFDEDTFLEFSGNLNEEVADLRVSPSKNKESHPAGCGVEFDKIAFNVFGQGPFIKHYLSTKHLQNEDEIVNKVVTRTEINEKKLTGCQTYNELISDYKKLAKIRKKRHDRIASQVSREVQHYNKKSKKEVRNMIKLQKELVKRHYDIKVLSQKIMDMMSHSESDITGKVFVSNVLDDKKDQ